MRHWQRTKLPAKHNIGHRELYSRKGMAMTKDERVTLAIVVMAILIGFGILFYWAEYRINLLQDRVHEMECRHVLFEDGSSLHKDAELTQLCIRNGG
jgi:hypothetical protein